MNCGCSLGFNKIIELVCLTLMYDTVVIGGVLKERLWYGMPDVYCSHDSVKLLSYSKT